MKTVREYLGQFSEAYPEIDAWYTKVERDPTRSTLVFRTDEEISGLAILRHGEQAKLCHFSVAPFVRGTGEGERLMKATVERSLARGDRDLHLTMGEPCRAESADFFRRFGFSEVGRYPLQYRRGVDELVWKADLDLCIRRVRAGNYVSFFNR